MEWMNRAGRPTGHPGQTVAPNNSAASTGGPHHSSGGKRKSSSRIGFHNITTIILLFSVTLLAIALIGFLMFYKQNDESKYVAKDRMQAVFLNGGQVYFGKVRALNNKYVGLTDIYYLRVNQQVQPKQGEQAQQDISLVKLGCELHGPQDQMLINRDQVVFWENLKTDGQVAKAVEQYKEANPNGQQCDTGSQQTTPTGDAGSAEADSSAAEEQAPAANGNN